MLVQKIMYITAKSISLRNEETGITKIRQVYKKHLLKINII